MGSGKTDIAAGGFARCGLGPSAKAEWYRTALRFISDDRREKFNVLYNARNGDKDFSIHGIGAGLRDAYADSTLQFRLPPALGKSGYSSAPIKSMFML